MSDNVNSLADPLYVRAIAERIASGSVALDDPSTIPVDLTAELDRTWLSLPVDHRFLLHRMLGLLALMREPATDDAIASILNFPNVFAEDVADLRRHIAPWLIFKGDGYVLAHERLKSYLTGNIANVSPADIKEAGAGDTGKFRLNDLCAFHEALVAFYDVAKASCGNSAAGSLDRMTDSGLRFLAWHLGQFAALNTLAPETEAKHTPACDRLYSLLQNEEFRRASVARFGTYDAVLGDLRVGITVFVSRQGATPLDDARLCWLTLKSGAVWSDMQTGLHSIVQQSRDRADSDPSMLEAALAQVQQLSDLPYYEAVCWLLWCECARQETQSSKRRTFDQFEMLIRDLERRMGQKQVEAPPMEDVLVPDLMAHLVVQLIQFVSVDHIIRLLETKRDGVSLRLIRCVAECAWRTEGPAGTTCKNAAFQLAATRLDLFQRIEAICALAEVAAAARDDETCQRLLCQAESATEAISNAFLKYRILETVMDAARCAGSVEIGTRALRRAITIIPSIAHKGQLAYAYAKAGLNAQTFLSASETTELFEKAAINASDVEPVERKIEVLSTLGHVLACAKRSDASQALFNEAIKLTQQTWIIDGNIVDIGKLGKARCLLGKDLAASGRIDTALSIAASLPGANAEILRDAATELAIQGKLTDALTVANTPQGASQLALAKGGIPRTLAAAGRIDEALQVASTIDIRFRKRPLAEVAGVLARQGHTMRALDTFQHALTLGPPVDVNLSHLRLIAQAYAVRGAMAKCRGVVALLPAPLKRGSITLHSRTVVARDILAAVLKYGNLEAVFAAAEQVPESEKETYVSVARVDALTQIGRVPDAIALARSIQSSLPRAEALTRIAVGLVRHQQLTEALALLIETEGALDAISDSFADRDKAECMSWIAYAYQQLGDEATSSRLLARIENMAQQYRSDPYIAGRILSNLSGALAKVGRFSEMEDMIARTLKMSLAIYDPKHRADLVGFLVRQLVSAGMLQHRFTGSTPHVISPHLSRGLLSAESWNNALREWQHGAALSGGCHLAALRQSLLIGSSELAQALTGVSSVLSACISSGDDYRSSLIIRECPQLGLPWLHTRRQTL